MDLYTPKGAKVMLTHPQNGYPHDYPYAKSCGVVDGEVYTVEAMSVGRSSSTVTLSEFPGKRFNTVLFDNAEPVKEEDACDWFGMEYGSVASLRARHASAQESPK